MAYNTSGGFQRYRHAPSSPAQPLQAKQGPLPERPAAGPPKRQGKISGLLKSELNSTCLFVDSILYHTIVVCI